MAYPSDNGSPPLEVLEGINLDVTEGEFLSIVGPSGCGKSTLLRLIGGLRQHSSGELNINQKTPDEARKDRTFGFVFQNPVIFEWRTVSDNIKLPGEIFKEPISEARVEELIQIVGLVGFENAYPRQLSGGMQSRVAIARVLSYNPKILLMDEPFGDLDDITRERMNLELLRIWDSTNLTIIFVTHSISEAVFLSDRVAVMSSKPSRIKDLLPIDLQRPRRADIRHKSRFVNLVEVLRKELEIGF